MRYMFSDCRQLKDIAPLANWDVSNVRDMNNMFSKFSNCSIRSYNGVNEIQYRDLYLLKCKYDVLWERALNISKKAKTLKKENTELSAHIANLEEQIKCLEEQIITLTETLEQTQKDEAKHWYQPLSNLFAFN
jgi:surface protein